VDAPYYQHAFLCFHFAGYFSHELSVARINVTRIQRASERAKHSTGCRRNHVVNGGRVRLLKQGWVNFVMLGYGPVYAENNWLRFTR
jgi:hypothetical protein